MLRVDSPVFSITDANTAFESLVGAQGDNLVNESFFSVFLAHTNFPIHEWVSLIEKATHGKCSVKTPVIIYHREPALETTLIVPVCLLGSVAPVFDSDGMVGQWMCSFSDVTELKSSEEVEKIAAISRDAKLLERTQRFAEIGTWEVDLANNTILWSARTREVYEVADDFKPSFADVMGFFRNDADRQAFRDLVDETIEKRNSFDIELQIKTAAGNDRWIRITGEAEYTDDRCIRIYGVIRDTTERKETEQLLTESRNQLQSLIQSVNGIFWEADASEFEFSFVSDHVTDILGYTPEEWLGERHFWENHIHPDDLQQAVIYCQSQVATFKDHSFDYRMISADGSIIWIKDIVSVIVEKDQPTCLRGLMVDITESKRIEELAVLEKSILELNTTSDTSLHELVIMYLTGIEAIFPGMQCSLHKVKDNCLEQAFAPSISSDYVRELYNIPIGPSVGSCGTAAFRKERVVVGDIANDPGWADYKNLALAYNLLACWSQPIINSEGVVIATLGFYYDKVKLPEESELIVIERCAAILKIILENRQKTVLLEESSLLMNQGQELAGFGSWQWDILNNVVQWSDELYEIYGLDRSGFKATFEGYQELLHPDDRERVTEGIIGVLQDKNDIIFEERIVRGDGEIRHLKSWGRLRLDENGKPLKMIGACLDITENRRYTRAIEEQNERLKNIAFLQSHVVRPPLARLMAAVNVMRNYHNSEEENKEILDCALESARELDGIIKEIAEKTREVPMYL